MWESHFVPENSWLTWASAWPLSSSAHMDTLFYLWDLGIHASAGFAVGISWNSEKSTHFTLFLGEETSGWVSIGVAYSFLFQFLPTAHSEFSDSTNFLIHLPFWSIPVEVLFSHFCQLHLQLLLRSALLVPLPGSPRASYVPPAVTLLLDCKEGAVHLCWKAASSFHREGDISFPWRIPIFPLSPFEYLEWVKIWGPQIWGLLAMWIWEMYVNVFKLKFPSLQRKY